MILALLLPVAAKAAPVPAPPRDIARFLERRAACEHWTGEEAYDAARRREIETKITALRCATLERDEAKLRKRYAGQGRIVRLLDLSGGND